MKEYLESELRVVQHEKGDIQFERERYARLSEHERQIQEERKVLDTQRLEFQLLQESLKKNLQVANELTFFYNSQ